MTLLFALVAALHVSTASADTIRIGATLPMTGVQSVNGKEISAHIAAAVDDLNALGAYGAHKAEFVFLDDGYMPNRTAQNVTSLIEDKRVHIIVNTVGPANITAGLAAAKASDVSFFAPVTGSSDLYADNMRPRVVAFRASYRDEVAQQAKMLSSMGIQRIAIVYQDDGIGVDVLAGWDSATQTYPDLQVVGKFPVARNTDAIEAAMTKALETKADAVVVGLVSAPALKAVKFMRSQPGDKRPYPVLFAMAATGETLASMKEIDRGGILFSAVTPTPSSKSSKLQQDYAAFCAKHAFRPSFRGLEVYVTMRVLAEQTKKLRTVSAAGVGQLLAGLTGATVADQHFPLRGNRHTEMFFAGKRGVL